MTDSVTLWQANAECWMLWVWCWLMMKYSSVVSPSQWTCCLLSTTTVLWQCNSVLFHVNRSVTTICHGLLSISPRLSRSVFPCQKEQDLVLHTCSSRTPLFSPLNIMPSNVLSLWFQYSWMLGGIFFSFIRWSGLCDTFQCSKLGLVPLPLWFPAVCCHSPEGCWRGCVLGLPYFPSAGRHGIRLIFVTDCQPPVFPFRAVEDVDIVFFCSCNIIFWSYGGTAASGSQRIAPSGLWSDCGAFLICVY